MTSGVEVLGYTEIQRWASPITTGIKHDFVLVSGHRIDLASIEFTMSFKVSKTDTGVLFYSNAFTDPVPYCWRSIGYHIGDVKFNDIGQPGSEGILDDILTRVLDTGNHRINYNDVQFFATRVFKPLEDDGIICLNYKIAKLQLRHGSNILPPFYPIKITFEEFDFFAGFTQSKANTPGSAYVPHVATTLTLTDFRVGHVEREYDVQLMKEYELSLSSDNHVISTIDLRLNNYYITSTTFNQPIQQGGRLPQMIVIYFTPNVPQATPQNQLIALDNHAYIEAAAGIDPKIFINNKNEYKFYTDIDAAISKTTNQISYYKLYQKCVTHNNTDSPFKTADSFNSWKKNPIYVFDLTKAKKGLDKINLPRVGALYLNVNDDRTVTIRGKFSDTPSAHNGVTINILDIFKSEYRVTNSRRTFDKFDPIVGPVVTRPEINALDRFTKSHTSIY